MKLKEFIENLSKMVKENPSTLDLDVVYSSDDEGNSYQKVGCGPSLGMLSDGEMMFIGEDEGECSESEVNVIVIN